MKIGILTVPFNNNYGGFLQAFALKQILTDLGHEVAFINRRRNQSAKTRLVLFFCEVLDILHIRRRQTKRISINTNLFVQRYLTPMTRPIYSKRTMNVCNKMGFDCVIVGSDQVWRYHYAKDSIDEYFLSFLDKKIRRFSYAASFGIDECDYPDEKLKVCTELLELFKGISVREDSAILLLESSFSVKKGVAQFVLDPTMLLGVSRYVERLHLQKKQLGDYLFSYILDAEHEKNNYVELIKEKYHLEQDDFKAQTAKHNDVIRPVEEWVDAIYNSTMVVTDSFHGMVFSIIFNKPFYVFVNRKRGITRFESLLGRLELQDRMVFPDFTKLDDLPINDINWTLVNSKVAILQSSSMDYLKQCLQ